MEQVGIGRTAEIMEVDDSRVLKLFYPHISHKAVEREYKINLLLSDNFKSRPAVYEMITRDGRPGIVYQKVDGVDLGRYMLKNIFRLARVVDDFSSLHCEINEVQLDGDIGDVSVLVEGIRHCPFTDDYEKNLIVSFLQAVESRQLCHGDFHPENVLVDSGGKLWVIDWLTAFTCNPFFDIARTWYLLRYGVSPLPKPFYLDLLDKAGKVFISDRYLNHRIKDERGHNLFVCYLYIVLLLRRTEGIDTENRTLDKLLKRHRKKAVLIMKKTAGIDDYGGLQ